LTASLIIPFPSHQESWDNSQKIGQTYPAGYDTGSTAWIMVCTVFGFFLAPALVYLYMHLYNLHEDFVKLVVIIVAMVSFLWVIFSFSLAYGQDANGDQIMGYPITYYMFWWTGANSAIQNGADNIPNNIFAVYELGFALVTPTIVAASVYGRVNINAFLFFIFAWHLCVYTPIAHITWYPTGWLKAHIIEDFAGGIVVNMLSAATALAIHVFLGHENIPKISSINPATVSKLFPAVLVVWFLWFGFTAGKAHNSFPGATQAIVNVIYCSITSVLMSWFYDIIFDWHTTVVSMVMAILMGLIAILPAAGFVSVGGAMLIGIFTVLVTRLVAHNVFKEGNDSNQPFSLITLHGLSGTCGFFATAVFSYEFVNPVAFNGLDYGRGIPLSHHIAAILALWSCIFVAVLLLCFVVNVFFPLALDNPRYNTTPKSPTPNPVAQSPVEAVDVESGKEGAVVPKEEAKQIELSVI